MKKIQQKLKKLLKKAKLKKIAYSKLFLQKINEIKEDFKKSFEPGVFSSSQIRILALSCLIIFAGYVVLFEQCYYKNFLAQKAHSIEKKSPREMEINNLKKELQTLVKGHPIENMIPYIAVKDKTTVAYLIGIAKKESNWGKRKPVLDGQDCYNYWGFRAKRDRMGSGGHTCFDSPKDAVNSVANRIDQIIERNEVKSAKNMIVWKCGSDCSVTGGQAAADKWIKDVDRYAKKVLN